MIKQLLNSVAAKYRDWSVSRRSIICLSLRLRQMIDQLATDKLRYFARPCPIIVKYMKLKNNRGTGIWYVFPPFSPHAVLHAATEHALLHAWKYESKCWVMATLFFAQTKLFAALKGKTSRKEWPRTQLYPCLKAITLKGKLLSAFIIAWPFPRQIIVDTTAKLDVAFLPRMYGSFTLLHKLYFTDRVSN